MALMLTNSSPVIPALRYSVDRMVRDANVMIALCDTALGVAWACPACADRGAHIDALAAAWQALREWRDECWYLEADWEAVCRRARQAISAFAAWYAGVVEVQP